MTTTQAIDPVCKMKVNPATAAGSFRHEGIDYYFCNIRCRDKFAAANRKAGVGHSDMAAGKGHAHVIGNGG